jgi:hypothetical protein
MQEHIVCYTLIDITDSSALQRQNLNTLTQTISLRANPLNIRVHMMGNQDMSDYDFGENFGGKHNVWLLSFTVEQSDVFKNKNGELGGLEDDLHQVPIIAELLESATITPEIFDTKNQLTKNTYFNRQVL